VHLVHAGFVRSHFSLRARHETHASAVLGADSGSGAASADDGTSWLDMVGRACVASAMMRPSSISPEEYHRDRGKQDE
jgi:hypothetical protein